MRGSRGTCFALPKHSRVALRQNRGMARPPKNPRPVVDEPSKTQLKKNMHALQELGETLTTLSRDHLDQLDLPEALRDALDELERVGKHEARRRHMQFIGKLMRNVDPEPIRAALDAFKGVSATETAKMHRLEGLRTRLLEDEKTLHDIAETYPGADLQQLRVLRRNAIKEKEQSRPPRAFRELFRVLRELEEGRSETGADAFDEDLGDEE